MAACTALLAAAAIAEALGSPFHGDRVLTRFGGHDLLASSAASLSASSAHIGTAWRSLAGSALGLAGGAFMMVGAAESLDPPNWVLAGVMILTHAWATTLITG